MATKAVGQITVFDYSDGYSVMLTNPSYTFIGDEDSVRGVQSVTTRVVAMQGASQINASVDTSQIIKPTGFTVTSNGATPSPTLTIQANQSVTDAGVLTIPVTVATGVTVSLQWSYSIAFTGGKGDTGGAGRGVTGTTVQYAPGTLPTTPPSSGWDDTVPSVDEGKYLWVKTVFTYSSGDPVTTYSVAKQGEKGSTGNGISSTVVEYAESTSGVTPPATIASWGSDIPNVAQGNYLWTRTTTNYTGSNPTVSYSVARIGMDGEPATTYSLIVSHAAIVKSASGTFSPTSITLTAKSQTGTNAYANYSGRFKIEVYNGSSWSTKYTSSSNENTKSYTIPSGTTQVRCSLYLAGGTSTLLDQQTVPVVSDGTSVTITSKSVKYQKGTSGTTAPTGTWGDSIPSNIGENEYLWTQTIVNYSDGNSTEAYSVSRNAANGFSPTVSSTTVEYVESTSGTAHPTSGWSTTPPTTMTAGRYMWTKTTVTYDDGNTSESYAVSRNGSNGGDAYTVILDNESHTFAGGTSAAIAGTATVNVYAYKGTTAIAPTVTKANISGLPTGMSVQSVTNDSTNKKSTIVFAVTTSMVTRSGMVTIPVAADSKTFNKEFSYSLALQGTKGDTGDKGDKGDKGDSATAYSLIVSHAAIVKSASGTFSPTSITLTAKSQTGTNAYANYSGRFKIEVYNGSSWSTKYTSSSNENTKSYTIPSGTTQVRCSLYLAGGTSTLLDQQTVPVVSDGTSVTINTKSVTYQKGTSGTTAPTGTWSSTIPSDIGEGEYLWTKTSVTYSDGNNTEAYSVSRYAVNGTQGAPGNSPTVSTTVVEYAESTSGTSHPTSGWDPAPPSSVIPGSYMWTKTTVTYSDSAVSVSYAVSRNGSDGDDAYTIILDNESHTFPGGTSAAIAGTATVNVYAYKGTTAIAPTVTKANITGLPTGMTAKTVTNDSTNKKSTIVFQVTTSMVTRNGLVTIPVVADGKTFSKTFSYSLALQGIKGDTGDKGDKGDTGDKGDKGDRGATWYAGTGITGTSTTAKVFSGSGVASAIVGDHYLNTSTQNVYRCTVAGAASTAKWVYEQNIKGEQGIQGIQGIQGNKGDPGDTYYFHIKYSNDGGTTFTGNSGEDTGSYIGTYADTVEADSVDVGDYDWVKIEGTDGRNGADHNLLMDVYVSSLTKVDGPADRYLSDVSNSTTTGQFIAEANLPDPNATHFYRISATQAGKNRGLCWYNNTNPPIISGSTYRMGCYARASSGSPKMNLRFSANSANQKLFTVSNTDWQWFEYTAIFEDSGSTSATYKRTYFYCNPQAAGDALDMCGFRLERVTDDVLAIKLTADTAKADAATAQSTADDAAALAQAAKDSADGKITTFYQNATPTALATGDLWINTTNNQNALSRWNGTTWIPVDNKDLSTALQNAATAQATADGKIMTFAQNDAPTGTLDTGDLWVDTDDNNRLYRWNGTTWDEVTDKTNLVPNLTPWFDRPFSDVYNSTTNPNGYWWYATTFSTLTQLSDGWAHFEGTNSQTSGNLLLFRAHGSAASGVVVNGKYTCLVEFRNVVNASGLVSLYTQQTNTAQFWGDDSYDGFTISPSFIVDGAKIYKPMKCVTAPSKAGSYSLSWLMSIAGHVKPSQTVSFDIRVSLYEGTYTGPYKPYVDQELRADVDDAKDAADAAQTAANNAQATANQKKQTFISTPTPPYYEGDAYFKTESGESGSAQWYVCTNTRLTAYGTGESWEDDFEPTSYALESSLQSTKTELLEEDKKIKASVEEQKTYTDGKVTPLETRTSTLEQAARDFTLTFNTEISGLKKRTENNENNLSSYQKVFAFTENGLQISEQRDKIQTPSVLQIDNGKISFIVDGQEASYWSGENSMFYVGDIVVGLNKKAQFGNFAWIPRSNGNLSFRWVGSLEDNN